MRRCITILLALLCACGSAVAEVVADGTVRYGTSVVLTAAMGGKIGRVDVMEGEYIEAGDPIAELMLTPVYAPCSGTVESLFAATGDSADDAVDQYGAVLTLRPESLYTVYATTDNAYTSVRTGLISSGETVYLKCTKDGSHRGVGRITRIEDDYFLVETTGGAFYSGETVYVYMDAGCAAADRIGKGTVLASEAVGVKAEGDVARMLVAPGEFVEKGQLLMETVGALPEGGFIARDFALRAEIGGYVQAVHVENYGNVERGATLVELCPQEGLEVNALVPAQDIGLVTVGGGATVTLELSDDDLSLTGWVKAVSYLSETGDTGETFFPVRVGFNADDRVKPGMHVTVIIE
ncbi:MAG: HlyD family efflux transporter periplasmic adaptor subunit [Clostridia bacterium]|nr:HlyD family efflux transporter periplasmic adaptor subunit [Clostridia bacterium]